MEPGCPAGTIHGDRYNELVKERDRLTKLINDLQAKLMPEAEKRLDEWQKEQEKLAKENPLNPLNWIREFWGGPKGAIMGAVGVLVLGGLAYVVFKNKEKIIALTPQGRAYLAAKGLTRR